MRNFFVVLMVIACLSVVGCASKELTYPDKLALIHPGQTTKDRAVEILGGPMSLGYGPDGKLVVNWNYFTTRPLLEGTLSNQTLEVIFSADNVVESYRLIESINTEHPYGQ